LITPDVFPEPHLMGFPAAETVADSAAPVAGPAVQAVTQAARARNISVVVGMAERDGGHFYNTTLLITPDVFPETHLMGFPSAETVADIAEPVAGPTVQAVIQAARARNSSVVAGTAERGGGHFYSTTLRSSPDASPETRLMGFP
ncbi:nitrilase-related carbon-nitrogen hydrolase, partial [Citrobacter portucalensis]|uniref:nitrilase-related carbon-nitrogen hydrolase n=1 Tax=Citrobacter portucalensis TaxID=1639133 RepID=UPI00301D9A85